MNEIQGDTSIKFPFSFLTKYYALHTRYNNECGKKLPIYDKYVQEYINAYFETDKNKKFKKSDIKNNDAYKKFYNCMQEILEKEKESKEELNFSDLDNKIWFCAKLIQLILENKKISENYSFEIEADNNNYQAKYFNKILKQEITKKIRAEKGLQ